MSTKEGLLKAIKGVITQGQKSIGPMGKCLYRGPKGLKCAVGQLIPDSDYFVQLEGLGADNPLIKNLIPDKYKTDPKYSKYLCKLQTCHDSASNLTFVLRFKSDVADMVSKGHLPKYCLEAL